MRLKYYIRGIGIGIIFATLLLTISFYFGKDTLAKETISDAEIIKRATELGMVMTEEGLEENVGEDIPEESEEEIIADNDNNNIDESKAETSTDNVNEIAETLENPNTEDSTVEYTYVPFTVKGGESSEMVSKNLKKAGLIDSVDDFNKYLNKLKVDHLIQAGTFYVKEGSSYDDLVALLVNKDSRTTTPPKQD
ncbi:MAG: endolytic transglycosylase MltG [Pseudobutyrivibrio sp.]|nr:endolytic transglycosylase MltG [Pseudobutyrivibrio sp.]